MNKSNKNRSNENDKKAHVVTEEHDVSCAILIHNYDAEFISAWIT